MLQAQSLVEMHCMSDGIIPFQGDDSKSEDTQLGAQDTQKTSRLKIDCYGSNHVVVSASQ
jgi:hypothetical protein